MMSYPEAEFRGRPMRLAEALAIVNSEPPDRNSAFRASLVCGFTPLHLKTFLVARLRLAFPQRSVEMSTGLYGDLLGNLERIRTAPSDSTIVVIEWADLDARLGFRSLGGWRQDSFPDIADHVRLRLAALRDVIALQSERVPVAVCLPTLPLPPLQATKPVWQAGCLELILEQLLQSFALEIERLPGTKCANQSWINAVSPAAARLDVKAELSNGFPYTIAHASALSEVLAALIEPPTKKKGLITDLDNTFWKGVLGEVGVEAVSWSLDRASHLHAVYQELLRSVSETGALIAVASKNDAAMVDQAFLRKDLILTKDCIFPFEVHWGAKSESVTRILKTWNVAADSVVFVDDSPAELAEVASVHPGVECILFPESPNETWNVITRLRNLFAKPVVTEEDRIRLRSIRAGQEAERERGLASTADGFLEQASSTLTFSLDKETPDPRVLELFNKTNQFNLNGRRFTEAGLRKSLADTGSFLLKADYSDKFGNLGRIALVLGRRDGGTLHIDSWVMSCRAFSRRIEHACLDYLFRKLGGERMDFNFMATDRNKPLQEFLAGMTTGGLEPPLELSRGLFHEKCPRLYHCVEENVHG